MTENNVGNTNRPFGCAVVLSIVVDVPLSHLYAGKMNEV